MSKILFIIICLASTVSFAYKDFSSPTVSFSGFEINELTIQTDNDFAFHSKLDLIQNAQNSIKMIYFIYNNDYTSAFLTEKLIEAAERGVRIEILIDYITNYSRLDFYEAIQDEAKKRAQANNTGGSIEFRFYNRPSKSMILTAAMLSIGCGENLASTKSPSACSDDKLIKLDQAYVSGVSSSDLAFENKYNIMNRQVLNSGLLMSGILAKDMDVIFLATYKLQNNLNDLANSDSSEMTSDDKKSLKEFINTLWDSQMSSNVFTKLTAKLKLWVAYTFMADSVNPIRNIISGLIPYRTQDSIAYQSVKGQFLKDLDFFSDYTHHKLLLVDGQNFQLGGRNIEDSYHVSSAEHTLETKYLFLDTDAVVKLKSPSKEMITSFDRLFHFTKMTAKLTEVRLHAPNDVVASITKLKTICDNNTECLLKAISSKGNLTPLKQRKMMALSELKKYSSFYKKIKKSDLEQKLGANNNDPLIASSYSLKNHSLHFTSKDLRHSKVKYIENLHFNPNQINSIRKARYHNKKTYGAPLPLSTKDSYKNIHSSLYNSVYNACMKSKRENKASVFLMHNAYFAPPAQMLELLSKLSMGEWDCPKLKVEILTNSIETTDLSVINLFGRRSMSALLKNHTMYNNNKSSKITYKEYQKLTQAHSSEVQFSLHSKVFLAGDDIIIGSANADYRSYMMDTNNAIMIEGSQAVSEAYLLHYKNISEPIQDVTGSIKQLSSKNNIPESLKSSYTEMLKAADLLVGDNEQPTLADALDHAFIKSELEKYSVEHELLTPSRLADLKLGAIKLLRMSENMMYSIISPWGNNNEHYKRKWKIDVELCLQTQQPITRKRCETKLMRESEWSSVFQRRMKERRKDAKRLDGFFKVI